MNANLAAVVLLAAPVFLLGQGPAQQKINGNIRAIAVAVQKGDKVAAKKQADSQVPAAARNIIATCNNCHDTFR